MAQPLLSIGMIVKNEIRCLERCFQSLQPLRNAIPCELVVADTGSTDGSRELAERYADLVFDFPWVNDFAAARNAVMDRCSGHWYLSIDADEFLDSYIDELVGFLTGETGRQADVATLVIRNYLAPDMDDDSSSFAAVRLLRMATGKRYAGTIHESWKLNADTRLYHLPHTLLHHDGYAYTDQKSAAEKSLRNLTLLEPELEKDPHSGMRMLQCMESAAANPEKATEFARRGMQMVKDRNCASWEFVSPALVRTAIRMATRYHMPEQKEWLDWCAAHFQYAVKANPYTEIDVSYDRLLYHYGMHNYKAAEEAARAYFLGMDKKRTGGYDFNWFTMSNLYNAGLRMEQSAQLMLGESLFRLGRSDEALDTLRKVDLSRSHPSTAVYWLDAMELMADSDEAAQVTAEKYPSMVTVDTESERQRARRTAVLKRIATSFLPNQTTDRGWRLYRHLPDSLGAGARLMGAGTEEEALQAMGEVTAWNEMPPPALAHTIVLGVNFPGSFYQQPVEELRELAVSIPRFDAGVVSALALWPRPQNEPLKALQFRFELTAAVLRGIPADQPSLLMSLCGSFLRLARDYLRRLYRRETLEQEPEALPGLHQGAWRLLCAQEAEQAGDWSGSIQALREALNVAPALKNVVELLLRRVEQRRAEQTASPELLALAEQVRGILSRFPPNDPAVKELKSSPVYQRVAPLIEGIEAPVFGGLPQ